MCERCSEGRRLLDGGDTPAMTGIDVAASAVAAVTTMDSIMSGEARPSGCASCVQRSA
ncbi:MAG: hypothetical protein QF483_04620 [Gammaproteobacteria bacterium]|nr:hypothetical protein [Gammaproteobacteria bacterium]MDP7297402.1 hypothetical protein [Gammaproteobacteria bacterium]MDP7419142.1 hypothetical protein [Gammaproteobacteria bacterium]MDP7660299.1 hypothetical protein [Gammaproteobacteria bacterium]HJP39254.1 hypothetical protein [Gammaproteobacteria bacterium]